MSSITYHSDYSNYSLKIENRNLLTRFFAWTINEEKNRIAWAGISITVMTAILFPLTMTAILFNGLDFKLIIGAMSSLVLVLVTNLAALPTKYTIPAFLTGIIIDLVLIIASFTI
ncbi:MAG TPA: hypothetical protein VK772_15575 [Puia sp.]|nr:hypothetical protein [Puia sp.]